MPIFVPNAKTIQKCLEGIPDNQIYAGKYAKTWSIQLNSGMGWFRQEVFGDTSLVVDSYRQGNLLGSEEAKGVMFKFQAVTDLVDLEAQEMVFAEIGRAHV